MLGSLWGGDKEKPANVTPNRTEEVRKMAGFGADFDKAGNAAPDSTGNDIATPTSSKPAPRRGRPSSQSVQVTQSAPVNSQAAIDLAKQQEAIDKIAKEMMKDVAGMPYEVWAFVAADPTLALTKEEEKDLSDAYYLVAQSLSLGGMPKWLVLPLFLIGRNSKIVKTKLALLQKNENMKAINAIEKGKIPL